MWVKNGGERSDFYVTQQTESPLFESLETAQKVKAKAKRGTAFSCGAANHPAGILVKPSAPNRPKWEIKTAGAKQAQFRNRDRYGGERTQLWPPQGS